MTKRPPRPCEVLRREARKADIASKMAKTGKSYNQVIAEESMVPPAFFIRHQLVLPARYIGLMPYERKREVLRQFKLWEDEEPQSLLPWYAAFSNALELAYNRGILREFVDAVTCEFAEWQDTLPPKERLVDVDTQKYSRAQYRETARRQKSAQKEASARALEPV